MIPSTFFWERQDNIKVDWEPITIHGLKDSMFLDLAQYMVNKDKLRLRIATKSQALTKTRDLLPKTYYLLIGLYGEGAKPKETWVMLDRFNFKQGKKPYDIRIGNKPPPR